MVDVVDVVDVIDVTRITRERSLEISLKFWPMNLSLEHPLMGPLMAMVQLVEDMV